MGDCFWEAFWLKVSAVRKGLHEGFHVCFSVFVAPNGQHLSVWESKKVGGDF